MSNIIDEYLEFMLSKKASDLHISTGEFAAIRIDGDIEKISDEDGVLTSDYVEKIMKEIASEEQYKTLEETKELDFGYEIKGLGRFRVNGFYQNRGMSMVFRHIPETVLTMEQLGMDKNPAFKNLSSAHRGLVLVTGPTGSGKSTTLAAMIDYINKNYKKHIITIEDPIEFVHQNKKSLINQRELHKSTYSFENALRASLREDPDVILVGEMRDLETIKLALTAAETGHIVFGTLHTNSAAKTIDRIIDVFPGDEKSMIRAMLSESLVGVISQTLLKKKGGGRVAAHEIMIANTAIRNLIREAKIAQMNSIIQTGARDHMQTMAQSLKDLVSRGIIDLSVAEDTGFDVK